MFNFEDVIGQEEVKKRLIADAESGNIPHALMFCGPQGCGKMQLALAFAHYLYCSNRADGQTCGHCPQCKQWNKLVHPDLHFMFPIVKDGKRDTCDGFIQQWRSMLIEKPYFSYTDWLNAIDNPKGQPTIYAKESDEISKKLSLKSAEGGYKTTIIWMPEKFQDSCANKMLKLLEEPPQKTLFLLVSEEPETILPTIQSRTQRIDIPKINDEDIRQTLENKIGISPEASEMITHLANGNFIKALETLSTNEDVEYFFNLFVNLMRHAYQKKVKELKAWSEEIAGLGREKQKHFLAYCQRMIRESFINNLKRPELCYMTQKEKDFANKFSPFINEKNIFGIENELSEAQNHIEQNVNAKMVFFDFAIQMIVLILKR